MNRNSNLKWDQPIICEVVHVVRGGTYFDPLAKNVTFKFLTGNFIASLKITNPPPLYVLKTHSNLFLITHWKWIKVIFTHVMRFSMGDFQLNQIDFLNEVMSKTVAWVASSAYQNGSKYPTPRIRTDHFLIAMIFFDSKKPVSSMLKLKQLKLSKILWIVIKADTLIWPLNTCSS